MTVQSPGKWPELASSRDDVRWSKRHHRDENFASSSRHHHVTLMTPRVILVYQLVPGWLGELASSLTSSQKTEFHKLTSSVSPSKKGDVMTGVALPGRNGRALGFITLFVGTGRIGDGALALSPSSWPLVFLSELKTGSAPQVVRKRQICSTHIVANATKLRLRAPKPRPIDLSGFRAPRWPTPDTTPSKTGA